MKAILLIIAALLPFTASADFRPGRVRTSASAEMKIDYATGVYENTVKSVKLSAQVTDGASGNTGYTLTIDGQPINFRVTETEGRYGACGVRDEAYLNEISTGQVQMDLEVTNMSGATCERVIRGIWEATLTNVDVSTGEKSTLVISGNPEYFMLTL